MEKETISLTIERECLEALTFYLQKEKTSSLQKELGKMIDELYEKTVPADVREYLEGRAKKVPPARPKVKPPPKTDAERADEKD